MKMKKAIALGLAVLMIVVASVAGTIAWLQDKTAAVTNTFIPTTLDISLKESPINIAADGTVTYGAPAEGQNNTYPTIPGTEYKKDPIVSVAANSEECYLFVKFEETGSPANYYEYTSMLTTANGWTSLEDVENVWYRTVEEKNTVQEFHLLANDKITVKTDVTTDNMGAAAAAKLEWTAYAIQTANIEAEGTKSAVQVAWELASTTT